MNPAVLFLFLLSAPVAGCALRSGAQAGEEPRSRVDMALADASDSITRDLAILTGGNRVTAPAVPGASSLTAPSRKALSACAPSRASGLRRRG